MTERLTKKINLEGLDQRILFGQNGVFLDIIKKAFDINVVDRGDVISLTGQQKEVRQAETVINDLISYVRKNNQLDERYVLYAISLVKQNREGASEELEC